MKNLSILLFLTLSISLFPCGFEDYYNPDLDYDAFEVALKAKDYDKMDSLVETLKTDYPAWSYNTRSPLYYAIKNKDLDLIKKLSTKPYNKLLSMGDEHTNVLVTLIEMRDISLLNEITTYIDSTYLYANALMKTVKDDNLLEYTKILLKHVGDYKGVANSSNYEMGGGSETDYYGRYYAASSFTTFLKQAAVAGQINSVKYLLKSGYEANGLSHVNYQFGYIDMIDYSLPLDVTRNKNIIESIKNAGGLSIKELMESRTIEDFKKMDNVTATQLIKDTKVGISHKAKAGTVVYIIFFNGVIDNNQAYIVTEDGHKGVIDSSNLWGINIIDRYKKKLGKKGRSYE